MFQYYPFLECFAEVDDDEILALYADSISKLTSRLGSPKYIHHLLQLLEQLCKFEDIVIQDAVCSNVLCFYFL